MPLPSLKDLIHHHKSYIIQEMKRRLGQLTRSPYHDFILRTEDGQRRFCVWVDLVARSLGGDYEAFFKDQERVGYARADQGFELEAAFQIYTIFKQVVYELLERSIRSKKMIPRSLYEALKELDYILFQGFRIVSDAYMKTREDIITEKIAHLKELYSFTQEIISLFDLGEIAGIILTKLTHLFGAEITYLVFYQKDQIREIYSYPQGRASLEVLPIIEKSCKEGSALFVNEEKNVYREVDLFQLKRVVSVPIFVHERCYGSIALVNNTRGLEFTRKELSLLKQFLFIMGMALENVFMLEEIRQSHQELRSLTGKMITLQEEERRRLAADIHDTIAQTLTGISYKLQSSREIAKRKPELLMAKLNDAIESVHQAIDQSRELMSSLRPELIDTAGIIPALKHLLDNYTKETGITVSAQLPEEIQLPSDVKICLFRILQEGLTNVYKHADTETAEVILKEKNNNIILLLSDNGKGFDMSRAASLVKDQNKLGLLSMNERVEGIGGTFSIHSEINRGCKIEAKIPFTVGSDSDE